MAIAEAPAPEVVQSPDLMAAVAPGTSWSYSKLDLFEKCAWRWLDQYAYRRFGGDNESTARGRLTHVALAELVVAMTQGIDVTRPQAVNDAVARAYEREPKAAQLAADPDAYEEVRSLAESGILHFPFPQPGEQVLVEQEYALQLPPGRVGTPEGSKPDRITVQLDVVVWGADRLRFTDWKTNHRKYRVTETRQVPLYGAVARRQFPGRQVEPELRFLRFAEPVERPRPGEFEPWMDEAARWAVRTIRKVRETAARGDDAFGPQPGEHCRYCEAAARCPLVGPALERAGGWAEAGVLDAEAVHVLARDMLVLDAAVRAGRDHLRRWIEESGPVRPEGVAGQWVLQPKRSVRWHNLGEVIALLPELGIPVDRVVTLDGKVMGQKLRTKRGEQVLAGTYERVVTGYDLRFQAREDGGDAGPGA